MRLASGRQCCRMHINPRSRQRQEEAGSASEFQYPCDELLLDARMPIDVQQADCCVAKAAYRILLPAAGTQARPAELLFCGHHFRASREGLRRSGATAFDAAHHLCSIAG